MKWKLVTERAFNFQIPEWVTCGEFKYSEEYGLKKRIIKDILITSNTGINILFREDLWLSLNHIKEVFKCDDPKKFVNDDDNITIENAKLWVLNIYSFWKYDKNLENISFTPAEVPYITQVKKNGKEKWKLYGIIKKYQGEKYSNMDDLIEKCGDIDQKWYKINESKKLFKENSAYDFMDMPLGKFPIEVVNVECDDPDEAYVIYRWIGPDNYSYRERIEAAKEALRHDISEEWNIDSNRGYSNCGPDEDCMIVWK